MKEACKKRAKSPGKLFILVEGKKGKPEKIMEKVATYGFRCVQDARLGQQGTDPKGT